MFRWAQTELLRIALRRSARSESHGIELRSLALDYWMHPLFFAKVSRALDLIGDMEPRRLARIQRDVSVIMAEPGGPSYWYEPLRIIALSWTSVLPLPVTRLATTIVHEATHARIGRAGVPYDEQYRARIEAACVAEEAAFARRLDNGGQLAEDILKQLESPWWTPKEAQRLAMVQLRAHEAPEWIMSWMERRGRKQLSRRHDHP